MLTDLKRKGVTIIVCSDYPITEKIQALDFSPNLNWDSNDMGCLKPEASGLQMLLRQKGIDPGSCFVIGDRYEKDGKLAENLGAEYVILPPNKDDRNVLYRNWDLG